MNQSQQVKVEWHSGAWNIYHPGAPHATGIKVDSAVVNATRVGNNFVEGYIVAVHGLDQSIAERLETSQLRSLGIGAQYRARPAGQAGTRRVSLNADGQIQGGTK